MKKRKKRECELCGWPEFLWHGLCWHCLEWWMPPRRQGRYLAAIKRLKKLYHA